jgi:hypothetical protein
MAGLGRCLPGRRHGLWRGLARLEAAEALTSTLALALSDCLMGARCGVGVGSPRACFLRAGGPPPVDGLADRVVLAALLMYLVFMAALLTRPLAA